MDGDERLRRTRDEHERGKGKLRSRRGISPVVKSRRQAPMRLVGEVGPALSL